MIRPKSRVDNWNFAIRRGKCNIAILILQYQSGFILKSNAILQVAFFCVIFKPFFYKNHKTTGVQYVDPNFQKIKRACKRVT